MKTKLPIVIGITGHRQLRKEDIPVLKERIKEQMEAVISACPNSPVKVLSSFAEGADQLCAESALELNLDLIAALPMEIDEYKKDFSEEGLLKLDRYLKKAESVFVVPFVEKCEGVATRDSLYRQADIYISEHCNCLLALWDGKEPAEKGCGTAETVDMALNHSYIREGRYIKKEVGYVIHIYTPREEEKEKPGTIHCLGNERLYRSTLKKVDEINQKGADPDQLSLENERVYHRMLKILAILGTAIAVAFLLYDEVSLNGMILALGFFLALMFFFYKRAEKARCHRKYIEYRVLAECIRIQDHLSHIGSDLEVSEFMDWDRRYDTPWIHKTMQVYTALRNIDHKEDLKKDWLLEQKLYHEKAALKAQRFMKRNNAILKTGVTASVIIYVFVLFFEFWLVKYFPQSEDLIRTIIKVLAGGFSAASLFAANYYGKLSLNRVYEDHVRMGEFFKKAMEYLDRYDASKDFLKELIYEELYENSNWCSYEKDNVIDLAI